MAGFLAALGAGVTSLGEKLFDNYTSAKAATKSFDREVWMMSNRYQLQRDDMKKAGINPILGATQGAPMGHAEPAQTSKGGVGEAMRTAVSAAQARASIDNLAADSELKRAQAETERRRPPNVDAATSREVASAGQISAETENVKASLNKIKAEIDGIRADIAKKGAETVTLDTMRALDARLRRLDSQEKSLRMPEAELRGGTAAKITKGTKATEQAAGGVGHWIAGKAADLRDELNDLYERWQAERARKGRLLRKGK